MSFPPLLCFLRPQFLPRDPGVLRDHRACGVARHGLNQFVTAPKSREFACRRIAQAVNVVGLCLDLAAHGHDHIRRATVSGAPVVDAEGMLIGMLSKKDCMRAALDASFHQEWGSPVAGYMTTPVETLDVDLDLVSAVERFLASPFRRFPVLREGQLVGQISRADLLRALVENWR